MSNTASGNAAEASATAADEAPMPELGNDLNYAFDNSAANASTSSDDPGHPRGQSGSQPDHSRPKGNTSGE